MNSKTWSKVKEREAARKIGAGSTTTGLARSMSYTELRYLRVLQTSSSTKLPNRFTRKLDLSFLLWKSSSEIILTVKYYLTLASKNSLNQAIQMVV